MKYEEQIVQIYRVLASNRRALRAWQALTPSEREHLFARGATVEGQGDMRLLLLSLDDSESGVEYY